MLNNLFKKLLGGENQTRNQVLNRPQSQVPYAPQQVQQAQGLQPFGPRQEDDYTATQIAQPTSYRRPQVPRHGLFEQDARQIDIQPGFEYDPYEGQNLRNYFNF